MNRRAVLAAVAAVALSATALEAQAPAPPKTLEMGRGPAVVIVHDLGGSRTSWMATARRLMTTHRVVIVDLPGHGDTPLPDPFSIDAAAAALDLVLAKQNPDSTIVIGKGMGGLVLLHAMAAQPKRAKGLLLIDAGLKPPLKITDQQRKQFDQFIDANYDAFLKGTMGRLGRDSAQSVAIHAQAALTPPTTIKSYLRAALAADGGTKLAQVTVPIEFVASDRLFRSPGSDADKPWAEVAQSLGYPDPAKVTVRRVRDAGFLIMSEQPDSLAAAIRAFSATALATP